VQSAIHRSCCSSGFFEPLTPDQGVFGTLLNEERTTEQDLQGLREDKQSQYTSRSCAETTPPA
jgi:hypothetical protein